MGKASKWIIVVLALALIIVSFLLWKSTGNLSKVEADAAARARTNDSLKLASVARDSSDRVRDKIVHIHDSLKTRQLDSALHLLSVAKDSIRVVKKTLQQAVADLGVSISSLNDSAIKKKYDSVVNTLEMIYELGGNYINNSDSTMKLFQEQLAYSDSMRLVLSAEISDLKTALTTCTLNFDGLKKDFDKEAAKVKSQNLLAKIEIGVATGIGIFIGHILK